MVGKASRARARGWPRDCARGCAPGRCESAGGAQRRSAEWGAGEQTAWAREGMPFSPGPDPQKCSPPPHPTPPPNSRTGLRRAPSLSRSGRVCETSFVSYLYLAMLMSNSCGADGPGRAAPHLSGFRGLLLTWRRAQSRRGLYGGGGGRGGHSEPAPPPFFQASSATYLSGARMRPGGRGWLRTPVPPGPGTGARPLRPFSSSPPPARASSRTAPPPRPPSFGRSGRQSSPS